MLNISVFAETTPLERNKFSEEIVSFEKIDETNQEMRSPLNPVILEEDTSKRGEFEKHFICDDGSYIAISYPQAVHMEQGGKWENIELPLEQKSDRIVSNTNGSEISFANDTTQSKDGSLVSMSSEGYNINWSVEFNADSESKETSTIKESIQAEIKNSSDLAEESKPDSYEVKSAFESIIDEKKGVQKTLGDVSKEKLSEKEIVLVEEMNEKISDVNRLKILDVSFGYATVEYPGALGATTSLNYKLSKGKVKEDVVLYERGDFKSYSMNLNAAGLKAGFSETNAIALLDEYGNEIFIITAPYMYDAEGALSSVFDVNLQQEDDKYIITYTPDEKWLDAPERKWPVVIDPTVNSKNIANANQIDNFVFETQNGALSASTTWLAVGHGGNPQNSNTNKESRSYWRLGELPSIGNGTITSASFHIRTGDTVSSVNIVDLYRVTSSWSSGTIQWSNQPSIYSTRIDYCSGIPSSSPKWLDFTSSDVTQTVKNWYNGSSTNYGFSLRPRYNLGLLTQFFSAERAVSEIPYLAVTYTTVSQTYTVTYNGNGQSSGSAPGSQSWNAGYSLTLRTNTGNLAKNGYSFGGWNTNSSGTGTNYGAGSTQYLSDGNKTLYAKWVSSTIPVTSVSVTPSPRYVNNGSTAQLTATVSPSNATNKSVTWSSSNTNVADVNVSTGLVTGRLPGRVTIKATSRANSNISGNGDLLVDPVSSNYTRIYTGSSYSGNINTAGRHCWYKFTPTTSGTYTFTTTTTTGTSVCGAIYLGGTTASHQKAADGTSGNLNLSYAMTANTEYLIKVRGYNETSTTGSFSIKAEKETKAIVIIPGILGSSLYNTSTYDKVWLHAINFSSMALSENGNSVMPITSMNSDNYGVMDMYKYLYNRLKTAYSSQFDVIFYDYDWRMSNATAASNLETRLSAYSEVVLVAHSMGGLVASKYLSNSAANRNKTAGLITLGTPFVGSAKAINAMETGELIDKNFAGIDVYFFKTTVRNMSKNSYAAYQLLPTSNYRSKTDEYPVKHNGTYYSTAETILKNTPWSKMSNGTLKPQFAAASTFHSSLLNSSGQHIKDTSGVYTYTIATYGFNTITCANYDSNYNISLSFSNDGDGTVLRRSAGNGIPNKIFYSANHTDMLDEPEVVDMVIARITTATGVSSAKSSATIQASSDTSSMVDSKDIVTNARGWVLSLDTKRIVIHTYGEITLTLDGVDVETIGESLYANGKQVGNVWMVGGTGKLLYILDDHNYDIVSSGNVRIEYMNAGYFEKIAEYDFGKTTVNLEIGDYSTKEVSYAAKPVESDAKWSENTNKTDTITSHVYTGAELEELNMD